MSTDSSSITSIELWAAAQYIGRYCSTENKAFLACKADKMKGQNPANCKAEGDLVDSCTVNVVSDLKKRFPKEFLSFAKCLDENDYRYEDCRIHERALKDAWNKANGSS